MNESAKETILTLLAGAKGPVSGEELCRRLGVTRAAVWKVIDQLRREGWAVEARPRSGYRLEHPGRVLTEGLIAPLLNTRQLGRNLIVLEQVDSTNRYLKEHASALPDGTAVIARCQTAGRGRMQREFYSPAGEGLYLSVLLRPRLEAGRAALLTVAAAVAVAQALEAWGVCPQIKWVNDLLLGERKICGILTEAAVEMESGRLEYLIVGIGVDLWGRREDLPEPLRQVAGSCLSEAGVEVDGPRFAAGLLARLEALTGEPFEQQPLLEQYRQRLCVLGQRARLISPGREEEVTILDLDDDAALIVRDGAGRIKTVNAGEVSLRPNRRKEDER